ncbi:MAG: diaminopimelate decarboxylase [Bacteroidota bacterium]
MNKTDKDHLLNSNLSKEDISKAFSLALSQKDLIDEDDTSIIFYDLSFLNERIADLKNLFPPTTLHAIAVKANPLTSTLKKIKELGAGLEVASLPELYLAEATGFSADKIVFDSPAKTRKEIEYALKSGVRLNADSFDELDRIDEFLKTIKSKSVVGVRINPQVGSGSIKSTSVGDAISKFGIPINDNSERLKEYFLKHVWLRSIHVHIGSQGCPAPLIIDGIRKVLNLANETNESLKQMSVNNLIETFDIGGGLPVSYHYDKTAISMKQYHTMLTENFKELFNGQFKLITEFGRYIYANTGWVASKVEYVKREREYNIAITHVGADLLLRKCYNPEDWHHHITIVDKEGKLKCGTDKNKYIIAGPLCFAGDVIAKDLVLPIIIEGDYILIHDAGAYTLSMWSRYNSRQVPKVIGYRNENDTFEVLKKRESKEDLYEFWT